MLMVQGQTGEVDQKVDGGQDTNPNGKCIIVLPILFPILTQLIKYFLVTLDRQGKLMVTKRGALVVDKIKGGVDGGKASGGSGKFEAFRES